MGRREARRAEEGTVAALVCVRRFIVQRADRKLERWRINACSNKYHAIDANGDVPDAAGQAGLRRHFDAAKCSH